MEIYKKKTQQPQNKSTTNQKNMLTAPHPPVFPTAHFDREKHSL